MSLLSLSRRFFLTKGETNRVRVEAFTDLLSITQIYLQVEVGNEFQKLFEYD